MGILKEIIANKKREVEASKSATPIETLQEVVEPATRDFRAALENGRDEKLPRLIAEVKRKSPSKKTINEDLNVEKIVRTYNGFAAAISVLTDRKFFGGSLEDLSDADHVSDVPLLRKDFILDRYQLLEARQFGADAVLLIARVLEIDELNNLLAEAKKLGMDCLVEIHDEADLEKVLETSAEIIGINNRDLDSLEIDLATTLELVEKIPPEKIIVSESGINTREDLERLAGKVDAVLIGSALLEEDNTEEKLNELFK